MQLKENILGFLVGCHYKKEKRGVEWPIDNFEWGGGPKIVKKAENLGVKRLYCYIYKPLNPNSNKFNEEEDYKRLPMSLLKNSEKIYGEGTIEDFEYRDDGWGYIILNDFNEYTNYVPIEKVSELLNRFDNHNETTKAITTVKQRIRFGLQLTKIECEQITKLSIC